MNKRGKVGAAAPVSAAVQAGEAAPAPAGEVGPAAMLVLYQDQERLLSTIMGYLGPAVRDCLSALLVSKAWYAALAVGDPWTHILRRLYPSCMSLLTGGTPSTPQPMPPASSSSSSASLRHGDSSATAAASPTDPGAILTSSGSLTILRVIVP